MRFVIQKVSHASVTVEEEVIGKIGKGYLILLGVGHEDTEAQADKLWSKILKMRIFEDENGKTNLSLADVEGKVLVVSQFTLYANCKKGNRPITFYDERLKWILEETYGTMVYQEQIMQVSMVMSGFSAGRSDVLRKAMGKKKPPIAASIIELIMKISSAAWLIPKLGFFGTSITEPITWNLMLVFLLIAYIPIRKSLKNDKEV